jgi:hypothetical protein
VKARANVIDDIEVQSPNLVGACFGDPALPAGTPASGGSVQDFVDKIERFTRRLWASRCPGRHRGPNSRIKRAAFTVWARNHQRDFG